MKTVTLWWSILDCSRTNPLILLGEWFRFWHPRHGDGGVIDSDAARWETATWSCYSKASVVNKVDQLALYSVSVPNTALQGMAALFYGLSSVLIMTVNKVTLTVYGYAMHFVYNCIAGIFRD